MRAWVFVYGCVCVCMCVCVRGLLNLYDHLPSSPACFVSTPNSCAKRGKVVLPGQLVEDRGRQPRHQLRQRLQQAREEAEKLRVLDPGAGVHETLHCITCSRGGLVCGGQVRNQPHECLRTDPVPHAGEAFAPRVLVKGPVIRLETSTANVAPDSGRGSHGVEPRQRLLQETKWRDLDLDFD